MAQPSKSKTTRRDFLKFAAAGAAGVAAGPFISRNAQAKPVQITFARESSYVKNFDTHFQNVMAPAYEKATGIKIEYQIQAAGGSAVPQLVSMVENKNGADLAWVQQEWLYRDALVDVTDIAEEVGKQQGGWYDEIKRLSIDKGKWKSVPNGNIGQLMNYRRDWFDEVGIKKFPDTWDEFLEAGTKLKAKGHPFGMSMGHGFADNYSWLYPLLWSYGVTVMDKDGKKVALDSSETAKAVEYVKKLYKDACIDDCIGWLDPANNKAFLTGQISCTNNAYSIMVSAKRDLPEMGKVIEHGLNPKGPTGQRYHALVPVTHGVFSYSKDPQAAKDFLRWMMDPKQYKPVDRLRRHVFRSVPARLRQGARVGHRAARQAVPEGAGDRQAHVVAGAGQPPARGSDQPLDRDRHVHQGHHRHADQGRHRRGRVAAQDNLWVGVGGRH